MRGTVIHAVGDVRFEDRADPKIENPGGATWHWHRAIIRTLAGQRIVSVRSYGAPPAGFELARTAPETMRLRGDIVSLTCGDTSDGVLGGVVSIASLSRSWPGRPAPRSLVPDRSSEPPARAPISVEGRNHCGRAVTDMLRPESRQMPVVRRRLRPTRCDFRMYLDLGYADC